MFDAALRSAPSSMCSRSIRAKLRALCLLRMRLTCLGHGLEDSTNVIRSSKASGVSSTMLYHALISDDAKSPEQCGTLHLKILSQRRIHSTCETRRSPFAKLEGEEMAKFRRARKWASLQGLAVSHLSVRSLSAGSSSPPASLDPPPNTTTVGQYGSCKSSNSRRSP